MPIGPAVNCMRLSKRSITSTAWPDRGAAGAGRTIPVTVVRKGRIHQMAKENMENAPFWIEITQARSSPPSRVSLCGSRHRSDRFPNRWQQELIIDCIAQTYTHILSRRPSALRRGVGHLSLLGPAFKQGFGLLQEGP